MGFGLKKAVKKFVDLIKKNNYKRLFFKRQKNSFNLPVSSVKKSKKLGFTPDEYVIYRLWENNPNDYLSELDRFYFRNDVSSYKILLDNKIVFYCLIKNFVNTNKIYAYDYKGTFVNLEPGFEKANLLDKLEKNGLLVYKKLNLGGGKGFRLLEYKNGTFSINRMPVGEDDIKSLFDSSDYLIEEFCRQSEFSKKLWPYSVNTIRIITIKNIEKIQIVKAFQRIGMDENKCVDNACAGGLISQIDLATGSISSAVTHTKENFLNKDGNMRRFSAHPVTNSPIEGLCVPKWSEICDQIITLHEKLTFTGIEFIAWDVVLTDDGIKIIEANTSCSMDLLQTFGGVRNEIIGNWMKQKGYIQ